MDSYSAVEIKAIHIRLVLIFVVCSISIPIIRPFWGKITPSVSMVQNFVISSSPVHRSWVVNVTLYVFRIFKKPICVDLNGFQILPNWCRKHNNFSSQGEIRRKFGDGSQHEGSNTWLQFMVLHRCYGNWGHKGGKKLFSTCKLKVVVLIFLEDTFHTPRTHCIFDLAVFRNEKISI